MLSAGFLTASCAASLKLPAAPGTPAGDIAAVMGEATSACRAVSTFSAEIAVSGSVGGRKLRARLLAGLSSPASARIEAFAFGQQIFIFAARGNDATLLLTRDHRLLEHGRPDAVLQAVAGVPLDAADLRIALLGCVVSADLNRGRQIGDDWRIAEDGTTALYLQRAPQTAPWRLVAAIHRDPGRPAWRVEYRDFQNNLPRTVRLASIDTRQFDLRLALSQVDLNVKLEDAAFQIAVPPGTDPITLEELRKSGPLGGASP